MWLSARFGLGAFEGHCSRSQAGHSPAASTTQKPKISQTTPKRFMS